MSIIEQMQQELQELKESSNLRTLPDLGGISSRAAPFPKTGKGRGVWVELSY